MTFKKVNIRKTLSQKNAIGNRKKFETMAEKMPRKQ